MKQWKKWQNYFLPTSKNAYRPHLLTRGWLIFFLAITLGVEGFLVSNLLLRQTDSTFLSAVIASNVIHFTNTERMQQNVGVVQENKLLDKAAAAKAQDMALHGYFSHVTPEGKLPWQWIQEAGYTYVAAGENLAIEFSDSKDVVQAWMNSPTHRANIVKGLYKDIGVGVADGIYEGRPTTFVVQFFASPRILPATQVANNSSSILPLATSQTGSAYAIPAQALETITQPEVTTNWALGIILTIVVILLLLTFFIHIEVQSREMLMGGVVLAALLVVLLSANWHFLSSQQGQSTAVINAADETTSASILLDGWATP